MHIGIDLDNTVLDATSAHLHYYNRVSGLSLTPGDVTDFYIYRLYGWDDEKRDSVYREYGHEIHWNSPPLPMVSSIVRELSARHRISIITARPTLFRDVTVKWLEAHNIHYHSIAFTEDKLGQCIDSKVDVLIDDAPHYAEQFALVNRPVILYEQPYNLHVTNELVYRASNWPQVKQHVDHLESIQ